MASRKRTDIVADAHPPTAGHNSEVDYNALVSENFKLEDLIKAAQAKFDEWAKPHKERIAQIEGEMSRRMLESKVDSVKTDSGTAYFSDIMSTKVEDMAVLFDYVAERWDDLGADVKLNLPIGTVRQHMDNNAGALPPGMTHSFFKRLNIKRS